MTEQGGDRIGDYGGPGHGRVIGVTGGSGGVGSSTFAAVLALLAAARGGGGVLVDLDVGGGGIDVLLGIESEPGARWSGLHLAGGHLDPDALRRGLPHCGACAVLAADVGEIDPDAVGQVIEAAVGVGPVVLDLPRAHDAVRAAAVACCDLVVVPARADVPGMVAAHAVIEQLADVSVGVVVRRGEVSPERAARVIGAPLLGVLPPLAAARTFDSHRLPRATARVAAGVLAGLDSGRRPEWLAPAAAP